LMEEFFVTQALHGVAGDANIASHVAAAIMWRSRRRAASRSGMAAIERREYSA
jgi:hypothetical protein